EQFRTVDALADLQGMAGTAAGIAQGPGMVVAGGKGHQAAPLQGHGVPGQGRTIRAGLDTDHRPSGGDAGLVADEGRWSGADGLADLAMPEGLASAIDLDPSSTA